MKLNFCSEYDEFTMFLSGFKVGADAVVFDKEVEESLLCKIVSIVEDGEPEGKVDYEADFLITDGEFMVGVDVVRPAKTPNEFQPFIDEYFADPRTQYC